MSMIVFLHPDLGIGGAERLIVDMGLALQRKQHRVTIYTSHHNPAHCFTETRDGTLDVRAKFDWLPRNLFGRCFALCAFFRMIVLALYVRLFVCADLYIVDQVSLCIPILQLFTSTKVLFYCHYPDLLLTHRHTLLKSLYRKPLDWLEAWTTSCADKIFVNSKFTEGVVKQTFPGVTECEVLYPSLNVDKFHDDHEDVSGEWVSRFKQARHVFLSLNRYERKKNIALALEGFNYLRQQNKAAYATCHLVIAGGYNPRLLENVEHHRELIERAQDLSVLENVTFLRSVSDTEKLYLLRNSTAMVYTPSNEHFGIVPVESMYCRTPVVAVNSGGPVETVEHGVTGFLCEPRPEDFGAAMLRIVEEEGLGEKMGAAGRRRVQRCFSFDAFTERLNSAVLELG